MRVGNVPLIAPTASRQSESNPAAPLYDVLVGDHQTTLVDQESRSLTKIRVDVNDARKSVLRYVSNGEARGERPVERRINVGAVHWDVGKGRRRRRCCRRRRVP